MAVLHSPESAYAKESVKWEAQHTSMGPPGRPYVYRDFPMMLHRAARPERGGPAQIVEQVTVESDRNIDYFLSQGFRHTPLEAIDAVIAQEKEFATLAAGLEYEKRKTLSPTAAAEVEAAQAEVSGHLSSVPVTPIKPRAAKLEAKGRTEPSEQTKETN